MNTFSRIFLFSLVLVVLSCSNDFDLIEGEVNIPVVYGLIDAQDTAHYIRLEKAFVDAEIPANELALDPSNLYYDNAVVKLVRLKEPTKVYTLERVDGNEEGLVREDGAFASAPNYLYKIKAEDIPLEEEEEVELRIELPGEETITASTTIIEKPIPTSPNANSSINIQSDRSASFKWTPGNFAVLTSGTIVFKYRELKDGESIDKSFVWEIFKNTDKSIYSFVGSEFYSIVASNIEVDPDVDRFFLGIDYKLQSGGEEIESFLNVAQANLGITSSGDVPNFSNLSRGRGLFSSRSNIQIFDIQLTGSTFDELKNGPLTEPLNFR